MQESNVRSLNHRADIQLFLESKGMRCIYAAEKIRPLNKMAGLFEVDLTVSDQVNIFYPLKEEKREKKGKNNKILVKHQKLFTNLGH